MEDRRVEVPIIGRNLYMWFWGKTLGPRMQAKSATKKGSVGQRRQSAQSGKMYQEDRLHEMYDTRNKFQQTSMLDVTWKATSWVANGWGRLQMWGDIQDKQKEKPWMQRKSRMKNWRLAKTHFTILKLKVRARTKSTQKEQGHECKHSCEIHGLRRDASNTNHECGARADWRMGEKSMIESQTLRLEGQARPSNKQMCKHMCANIHVKSIDSGKM